MHEGVCSILCVKMNPCSILSFSDVNNFSGYETKSQEHYLDVLFESKYFLLVILMTFYLASFASIL